MNDQITWLLESGEPWTRYRTLVDLLDRPDGDPDVQAARAEMTAHPQVQGLIAALQDWPGPPLKRHNDAAHPFNTLPVLADFGLTAEEPGLAIPVERLLAQQHPDGPLQVVVQIAERYGGRR